MAWLDAQVRYPLEDWAVGLVSMERLLEKHIRLISRAVTVQIAFEKYPALSKWSIGPVL